MSMKMKESALMICAMHKMYTSYSGKATRSHQKVI